MPSPLLVVWWSTVALNGLQMLILSRGIPSQQQYVLLFEGDVQAWLKWITGYSTGEIAVQTSLAHNVALRDPDRICKMQNGSFAHMRKGETVHTFCLFIESVKNVTILRSFVRMKKSTRAEIRDCRRRCYEWEDYHWSLAAIIGGMSKRFCTDRNIPRINHIEVQRITLLLQFIVL